MIFIRIRNFAFHTAAAWNWQRRLFERLRSR